MALKQFFAAAALCLAGTAVAQDVPVSGAASVRALEGTERLVTVVLKDSGAQDKNLRVVEAVPEYVAFITEKGERHAYTVDSIDRIIVQEAKAEQSEFKLDESRALRTEDQEVVKAAQARALEVYNASAENQERKILAASVLVHAKDQAAIDYLTQLAASNDMSTALQAVEALYAGGHQELPEPVIRAGLASGNFIARGTAMRLAGYTGMRDTIPSLLDAVDDRSAEISAPAAIALGKLGVRDAIPALFAMLQETNEIKQHAAMSALTDLGGEEVIEQAKLQVSEAAGLYRVRLAELLFELDQDLGRPYLSEVIETMPTVSFEAAIVLASAGDWDASEIVRGKLNARGTKPHVKAIAAAALVKGGDPSALSTLQDMLRSDDPAVRKTVAKLIMEIGQRRLLNVLHPTIASGNDDAALLASITAVALADPGFRKRLDDKAQG